MKTQLIDHVKISHLLLVLVILLFTGCGHQSLSIKAESEVPIPLVNQIQLSLGVYYDDAFRNYIYTEDTTDRQNWKIESGSSQVALFDRILQSMFKQVTPVNTIAKEQATDNIDVILAPTITEMQFSLPQETKLDIYEVWIKYKISIFDKHGNQITEFPLIAYGKISTEFVKSHDHGLKVAIELALRDAGARMALGFSEIAEIKQWLASAIETET